MPPAHPPAAHRAYEATKDLILTGQLAAGTLLSEGEIAERLDISRTPVREAFLRLEAEDLLRLIPKRGAIVVAVPATEAADILDIRFALETAAVRRLAERSPAALPGQQDAELMAQMEGLLAEQAEFAERRDIGRFAEVDERFHRSIVTASGNAIADRFYATLGDRQRRMVIGAVVPRPERLASLVREHRALMELVRARDLAGFEAALKHHLDTTYSTYSPAFR